MLEGAGQSPNLVVVGTPLQRWKHREIDLVFKVILGALGLTLLQPVSWLLTLRSHQLSTTPLAVHLLLTCRTCKGQSSFGCDRATYMSSSCAIVGLCTRHR